MLPGAQSLSPNNSWAAYRRPEPGKAVPKEAGCPALRLYTAVYSSDTPHLKLLFFHEKVVDTWENMDYTKFNLKS